MMKLLKSKKALSPVVAAIILIAVTVAVSIAVAAWMGSMTFTFMETEELKITSIDFDPTAGTGSVTVNLVNTGTTDVTIISAEINGESVNITEVAPATTMLKGTTDELTLEFIPDAGTTYNIQILSAKGNKFSYTGVA